MQNLPFHIPLVFVATTMLTLFFMAKAFGYSKKAIGILLVWLAIQAAIASTGFYTYTSTLPPRFILAVLPPIIAIAFLFVTAKGKEIIDNLPPGILTILHVVRIPVELVLLMLFIHKTIPGIMTFEGRNLDILSGITAPFIYYCGFMVNKMKPWLIIAWNIVCLLLLANIVGTAVFSIPLPFQQFGFEQPNIALLYAPYIWLPSFIVPAVLFSHLVVLRQMKKKISIGKTVGQQPKVATV